MNGFFSSLAELHFIRPWWLLALLPWLAGLAVYYLQQRRAGSRAKPLGNPWARVCDPALLPYLLHGSVRSARWQLMWLALIGVLTILALAGPAWDKLPQPLYRQGSALVIVLDLSKSMRTADLAPHRLARARFKIADILNARTEGSTGLVVYAGGAYTVMPVSSDSATLQAQLRVLDTSLMPADGDRADRGLAKARELLEQAGFQQGNVLLVTDGVDLAQAEPAARELVAAGQRLSVLGVGTVAGAPVPGDRDDYLKDDNGAIVIATYDATALQRLAAIGRGTYAHLSDDDSDLKQLLNFFEQLQEVSEADEQSTDYWQDRGAWLVLLLLPFALLFFRRGVLAAFVLVSMSVVLPGSLSPFAPVAAQSDEAEPGSFWLRLDQQAAAAFAEGDMERAANLFRDPEWRGVAQYRAGDYEQALESLGASDTARSWYNRGNVLAQLQKPKEALKAYEEALKRDPEHEDARFNRDLLREEMQQQSDSSDGDGDDGDSAGGGQGQSGQAGESDGAGDGREQADSPAGDDNAGSAEGDVGADDEMREQSGSAEGDAEADDSSNGTGDESADADAESAEEEAAETEAAGQESDPADPGEPGEFAGENEIDAAQRNMDEQWLRRIPDDPGGLLRRKFEYQYQRDHADADY
ncbi:MAG: VWA domain-containing protein [Gammaproteobacteria bacterium]